MKQIILTAFFVMGCTPSAIAGDAFFCSGDGMTVTKQSTDANNVTTADFLWLANCPPNEAPDASCLTKPERDQVVGWGSYAKCIDNEPDGVWDSIVEWTQAEKDDQDAADDAASTLQTRTSAETTVDAFTEDGVVFRASLLAILDQINALRADVQAISEASNQIPDVVRAPFTPAQMKTAIKNKINAGDAD